MRKIQTPYGPGLRANSRISARRRLQGGPDVFQEGKNEMTVSALTPEVDSREDMKRLYFRRLKRCSSAMNPLASLGF